MNSKARDPILELVLWTALLAAMTVVAVTRPGAFDQKIPGLVLAYGWSFPIVMGFWLWRMLDTESRVWRALAGGVVVLCVLAFLATPGISASLEARTESSRPSPSLAFSWPRSSPGLGG